MTTAVSTDHFPSDKRAVCWLDVLIFAVVIILGFTLWNAADRYITAQSREHRPFKEEFEHGQRLPVLQVRLGIAQDELKALNGKLSELRIDETRLASELTTRPRVRLLSPQREDRTKLRKIRAAARALESQVPRKIDQVAATTIALANAKHSAQLAYEKALRHHRLFDKLRIFGIVVLGWSILALVTWRLCVKTQAAFKHGTTSHVLVPATLLFVFATIYYFAT